MHRLLAENLDQLCDLCRKHRVKALYLFGSATRDDFETERSDLDFVVEFLPHQRAGFADVYFKLHADLEKLFGREIDLVERAAIRNPYFREAVESEQVRLYDAA